MGTVTGSGGRLHFGMVADRADCLGIRSWKLNDVDSRARLVDFLTRLTDPPAHGWGESHALGLEGAGTRPSVTAFAMPRRTVVTT